MEPLIDRPKVEFEEESRSWRAQALRESSSKMEVWVIKYSRGYITDRTHARYFLVGFAFVAFAFAFYPLLFGGGSQLVTKAEPPSGYKIVYPKHAPPRLEKNP